jgi:hypothetical protein
MLDDYNYQERVSLLGNLQGEAWVEAKSGITLAEAVRTVVEEWDLRHQMTVMILRVGNAIFSVDEIRDIYDRADFPR